MQRSPSANSGLVDQPKQEDGNQHQPAIYCGARRGHIVHRFGAAVVLKICSDEASSRHRQADWTDATCGNLDRCTGDCDLDNCLTMLRPVVASKGEQQIGNCFCSTSSTPVQIGVLRVYKEFQSSTTSCHSSLTCLDIVTPCLDSSLSLSTVPDIPFFSLNTLVSSSSVHVYLQDQSHHATPTLFVRQSLDA